MQCNQATIARNVLTNWVDPARFCALQAHKQAGHSKQVQPSGAPAHVPRCRQDKAEMRIAAKRLTLLASAILKTAV